MSWVRSVCTPSRRVLPSYFLKRRTDYGVKGRSKLRQRVSVTVSLLAVYIIHLYSVDGAVYDAVNAILWRFKKNGDSVRSWGSERSCKIIDSIRSPGSDAN